MDEKFAHIFQKILDEWFIFIERLLMIGILIAISSLEGDNNMLFIIVLISGIGLSISTSLKLALPIKNYFIIITNGVNLYLRITVMIVLLSFVISVSFFVTVEFLKFASMFEVK